MTYPYKGTLASVGFRARRIEAEECERATKADIERAAGECTTFLDRCAAEAQAARWFATMHPRSQVMERILGAIAERGPLTAAQIRPIIGYQDSAVDKALKTLRETGQVAVIGKAPTMGRPQIYGLPEEEQ